MLSSRSWAALPALLLLAAPVQAATIYSDPVDADTPGGVEIIDGGSFVTDREVLSAPAVGTMFWRVTNSANTRGLADIQINSETVQAGTYTLDLYVGCPADTTGAGVPRPFPIDLVMGLTADLSSNTDPLNDAGSGGTAEDNPNFLLENESGVTLNVLSSPDPGVGADNWVVWTYEYKVTQASSAIGKELGWFAQAFTFNPGESLAIDGVAVDFVPVPEPASLAMLFIAFVANLAGRRLRERWLR